MSDSPLKIEKRLRAAIEAAYKVPLGPGEKVFIGSSAHANVQRAERALVEHWLDQGEAVTIIAAVDKENGDTKATPDEWAAATKRARADVGDEATPRDVIWHLNHSGGASPGHSDAVTLSELLERQKNERTWQ